MPEIIPVRQGYRDLYKVMTYLGALIVTGMVGLLWSAPSKYDGTIVAWLCAITGFLLIFPGFTFWVSLWNVLILREGRLVLGEDGRLTYAWRTGNKTLDLAQVHKIRWWWPKFQNRWGEPMRLWTEGGSLSLDPSAFTVPDRERLAAWLRAHLLPEVAQLGQEEFAQVLANMLRTPRDWADQHRWLFGWRFLILLVAPASFAALVGVGFWAFLRLYYPDQGPVDVSGRLDGPFGRIVLATPAHWALFLALPVQAQVGMLLGSVRGIIWLDHYTNRDTYAPSSPTPQE